MTKAESRIREEMIPISLIGGRYLLFSIDHVTYLRREHRICGVLIGSLPQAPQQNIFLGLPLELMPEEVRLLTEKGAAHIVDDAMTHSSSLADTSMQSRRQYLQTLQKKGQEAADMQAAAKRGSRDKALGRVGVKANCTQSEDEPTGIADDSREEFLFSSHQNSNEKGVSASTTFGVTPATSASLLDPVASPFMHSDQATASPPAPPSYPLFKHLNSRGYFSSPGLRFGCQYLVYPGDPLRFHSHFLASSVGWDQKLDLMGLVGGGRLGTGVKKAYLIGGQEEQDSDQLGTGEDKPGSGNVRTFSIEWAAM